LRGNHRDGWVFGAADPLSGQVALLEEAKAIGQLARHGWRPKRTLVYLSWDGEEPGLLGSTEWVETHAAELKQKAVLYINSDNNDRGFLSAGGNQDFEHFVNLVANDVIDPETHVSIANRLRAKMQVEGAVKGANEDAKTSGKLAADQTKDFPIEALGSGSDYSAFLEHLGVPALNIGYGAGGPSRGVGLALVFGVDRFMSVARANTNLIGNGVATIVLASREGSIDRDRLRRVLDAS
jgi:N-acetylated-alpha-linked acidic dipeptidase